MGLFNGIKEKAIRDANSGKKPWEKEPNQMTNRELDRELTGNKSIVAKKKYAEEKLKRMGKL